MNSPWAVRETTKTIQTTPQSALRTAGWFSLTWTTLSLQACVVDYSDTKWHIRWHIRWQYLTIFVNFWLSLQCHVSMGFPRKSASAPPKHYEKLQNFASIPRQRGRKLHQRTGSPWGQVWKMGGWSECLSNRSSFPSHKLWTPSSCEKISTCSSRLRSFGRCLWCSEVKTNCAHLFSSESWQGVRITSVTFKIFQTSISQWIGLRENWNRKAPLYFMGKSMVSCRFSLKPIHWNSQKLNPHKNDLPGTTSRTWTPIAILQECVSTLNGLISGNNSQKPGGVTPKSSKICGCLWMFHSLSIHFPWISQGFSCQATRCLPSQSSNRGSAMGSNHAFCSVRGFTGLRSEWYLQINPNRWGYWPKTAKQMSYV